MPQPTIVWRPARGIPSEFLDETYPAKTRGMGLLYGENCMILTSIVFDWSTRVTDRRSDRQTDGLAIAYSALSMLSRAKNVEDRQYSSETREVVRLIVASAGRWRATRFQIRHDIRRQRRTASILAGLLSFLRSTIARWLLQLPVVAACHSSCTVINSPAATAYWANEWPDRAWLQVTNCRITTALMFAWRRMDPPCER